MKIILYIFIVIGVGTILRFFISTSRQRASINGNNKVLGFHQGIVYLGGVNILIGILFLLSSWPFKSTGSLVVNLIVCVVFCAMGIFLVLSYLNAKIIFGDEKIISSDVLGRKIEMIWADIEVVKHVKTASMLVLKSKNKKISVNLLNKGILDLKEMIVKKLSKEIYKEELMEL